MNQTQIQWSVAGGVVAAILLLLILIRGCRYGSASAAPKETRPDVSIAITLKCEGLDEPPVVIHREEQVQP